MIKKLLFIVLIAAAATSTALLSAEENWNEEFTKEGIIVYTRPVEGSSLNEFKGKGIKEVNLPARPFFFSSARVGFNNMLKRVDKKLKKLL